MYVAVMLVLVSVAATAQDHEPAFVFSAGSILLDVESYQGGIGAKARWDSFAVRAMLDFVLDRDGTNPESTGIGAGGTFEWHFLQAIDEPGTTVSFEPGEARQGVVTPYVGGFLRYGFAADRAVGNDDNWSEQARHEIELGPVAGVEFFALPTVSFFAEYELGFSYVAPFDRTSVDGTVETVTGDAGWVLDLGIGNSGMLGVCVYF